jgi:uncharacterized spore protein YtfJ
MKIDELVGKARESLGAATVYAPPYEKDGISVIAAASIAGGGGGGAGRDKRGQGQGGGFGLNARPIGAYLIKDGALYWKPAVDVNRLLIVSGAIVIAALVVTTRILKVRQRAVVPAEPAPESAGAVTSGPG